MADINVEKEQLRCPICWNTCNDAVETTCCINLLCEGCFAPFEFDSCPICRSDRFAAFPNGAMRRLIGSMKVTCEYCSNEKISRSDMKDHLALTCPENKVNCENCKEEMPQFRVPAHQVVCPERPVQCGECEGWTVAAQLGNHKRTNCPHRITLCSQCFGYEALSQLEDHKKSDCQGRVVPCPMAGCLSETRLDRLAAHLSTTPHNAEALLKQLSPGPDPIRPRINYNGDTARLGANGKYYCGAQFKCGCFACKFNDRCGPATGCNCRSCYALDIEVRGLSPGFFVNRAGSVCRWGKKEGSRDNIYCGRKILPENDKCDGWCGDEKGPACKACKILRNQLRSGGLYSGFA